MSTFQERFSKAFDAEVRRRQEEGEERLTKTMVWKAAKATSGAFTQWYDGTTGAKLDTCFMIAPLLRVNPHWLFDESAPRHAAIKDDVNIEAAPSLTRKVPLISFVRAGAFTEAIDNFAPDDADEWIDLPCPAGPNAFALRVVGDSMEPAFHAGMLLIVDPSLAPEQNDFVVAKNGDNEATFKQLVKDGNDWYLKPANPRYPIKPLGSSRIIGIVRFSGTKHR